MRTNSRNSSTGLAKKYLGEDECGWKQPGDERVVIHVEPDDAATQAARTRA